MASDISSMKIPGHAWYMYTISGVVLFAIGALVLMYPQESYTSFAVVFVIGFFVMSLIHLYDVLTSTEANATWWWDLTIALIYAIFSMLLLFHPNITKEIFPLILGFAMLFRWASLLWASGVVRSLNEDTSWRWVAFWGLITIVLSFVVMFNPSFAAGYVDVMLVILFISAGVGSFYAGHKLHQVHKKIKQIGK